MIGRTGPERETAPGAPPVPVTGHERVDAVLARAAGLDGLPVAEHPEHYEALHAALLAELDAEPGTALHAPVPRPGAGPERDGSAPHPEVGPGRGGLLPSSGAEPGWGGPR